MVAVTLFVGKNRHSGYLGIVARERQIDRCLVRLHNLREGRAVEVVSVDPKGPGQQVGVREGDLIVAIDEQDVMSVDDLHRFLSEQPTGRRALAILRGQERINVDLVPMEAEERHKG